MFNVKGFLLIFKNGYTELEALSSDKEQFRSRFAPTTKLTLIYISKNVNVEAT